ncbi:MAG: hypothetical protein SF053_16610 [Bacteroidia bacterium]|nr:hypothetical protein [Bacteroidia bacterium]
MMSLRKTFAVAAVAAVALFTASCETDPCANSDCGSQGGCTVIADEPVCLCNNGYEENADGKCEVRSTSKFVGNWTANESCTDNILNTTFDYTYDVATTESSADVTKIFMEGLAALACGSAGEAEPVVTVAMDAFTIDVATYCKDNLPASLEFSGYQFVSGSGTFDDKGDTNAANDEINLTYRVKWTQKEGSTTEEFDFSCTVKMTRK